MVNLKDIKKKRFVVMDGLCCGCRMYTKVTYFRYRIGKSLVIHYNILKKENISDDDDMDIEICMGCSPITEKDRGLK